MDGIQFNRKSRGHVKSSPGCLGRMVNLFDLTSGVSGNQLLTDKPHNDGSSLSRSQSYVSAMPNFSTDEIEDVMVSEFRSSSGKKLSGTPVKMLIAQEMSQDSDSRQSSPNVVARLMGLDALPQQHTDLGLQNRPQFYSQKKHSENPIGSWREEDGYSNKRIDLGVQPHQEHGGYTDMYEIWQESQRTNCRRDKSPQKGMTNENINDKKLALIRQKFMEAKRLATDEKLRQTKQFQEVLDVLSSDGDLFLKVLQEPNSFISKNLRGESFPPPPLETKRITVLRPSKMVVDDKFASPCKRNEVQMKNQPAQLNRVNLWDSSNHHGFSPTMSTWKVNDTPAQPTRIVLLKPSLAKANDVKPVVSSSPSSPRILHREYSAEKREDEDAREAREVAKEITLRMRENFSGHRRDETLVSSVLSNGYTGDESSFDNAGNLSDSEVMSPISRHSWDYVNRYGSPCSSSFSRASCSPESSVCREAKKRLSERWAMMSSIGGHQEPRHVRRSSSTLGEMLALSEIKKSEICEEEVRNNIEQDSRASTSCINSNMGVKEGETGSPRSLSRSRSVPVSSTLYGEKLTSEGPRPGLREGVGSKEAMKTKASKSSFAGKVTSLFFSRNKKIRNEKSSHTQSDVNTPGTSTLPQRTNHTGVGVPSTSRLQSGSINGNLNDARPGQATCSQQGEKHDEPSPISVLELPFEEDERVALDFSRTIDPNPYGDSADGRHISSCLSRSNLIDKSPPIGSIARTLSWDECSSETATNHPLNNSPFISPGSEDNEAEWRFLVQSVLTMAGLEHEGQLGLNLARWHSPDSPLDPSLREKFIDHTAKEPFHEAKRRQMRSTRKLVFDSVNAALVDMGKWSGSQRGVSESGLGDKVWGWMKEGFSEKVKLLSGSMIIDESSGDSNSLVERQVRKEVVGKVWEEEMRMEIHKIGREIERNIIQEIVEDSLLRWTRD